ncbi:NUDIX hydrolase [Nocardia sp. XZ_19_385]|uniref:NUDIX domain-containing protein n=1 Tax=Nocardia sp. XZ_19_385 TaxID=2769488 RepID=UPI00188E8C0C|nr:NUDIX hydrolase [Nocardia sp. XZ_19_385]
MNSVEPLYRRDSEAWKRHLAEGNAIQARKRVGADALVFDSEGRILVVDPNYKPDWDLPGGMAEANEPADVALGRELAEELHLHIPPDHLNLLCVDWVAPHGPWDDSLMFVFDAGILAPAQAAALRIGDGELDAYEFCTLDQVQCRLRPYVWNRVHAALTARDDNQVAYLHNGEQPW